MPTVKNIVAPNAAGGQVKYRGGSRRFIAHMPPSTARSRKTVAKGEVPPIVQGRLKAFHDQEPIVAVSSNRYGAANMMVVFALGGITCN